MQYRQLIKKVQDYSGFSDQEAEQSLHIIVETLSARLQEGERQDFASQLPSELQDIALKPTGQEFFTHEDFYEQLSDIEGTTKAHVKKQLMAVWKALKEAASPGELDDVKAQLPNSLAAELH
ncbi:MAG TPA: DUF2267 domain-containing protein [Candidatus Saccharimonadales bacterium]|nr:DUF2267 domain-containing protein [Candidatus Saccharimonadales bacterium]